MKVVLADDERIERIAMKKFLEGHFRDLEVVGEAVNGKKAVELADKVKPDIMLMDIKMPVLDGLEAVHQIHQRHPGIKFIIVSAYDHFDYAKKAMKEGVKEYILKPVQKQEIIQAMKRIMNEIQEERISNEKEKQSRELAKHHFLLRLIQFGEPGDVIALKEQLFPSVQCGFFMVLESSRKLNVDQLNKTIQQFSSFETVVHKSNSQMIYLFLSEQNMTKSSILKMARKIHLSLGEKAFLGIGYPYSRVDELPKSYQEALQAVQRFKRSSIGRYGFPPEIHHEHDRLKEEVLEGILNGDFPGAYQSLKSYKEHMSNGHELMDLYYAIKQKMSDLGTSVKDIYAEDLSSLDQWRDFLHLCCLEVKRYIHSKDPIEKARSYIHDHYHKSISLEKVAEYAGLSPQYFTHLFKKATSQTFIDYVTDLRLKKAKELMRENQYSLKEISYMVGYRDPNYFSRVFKKEFQISPRQYQKQLLKK